MWLQLRGEWPNRWLVVLHHFSSTGIFPWSMLDRSQQRNITGGAVMEGGAVGSLLHHPQTHSSENKQSLKLHQWEGSKGSLPPETPRRGVGQNERRAWWTMETAWNEEKIAFGFKGKKKKNKFRWKSSLSSLTWQGLRRWLQTQIITTDIRVLLWLQAVWFASCNW